MGVGSKLDRKIRFWRAILTPDWAGGMSGEWVLHGPPIQALREDVRDTESIQAGLFRSRKMARFLVRRTAFTSDLTAEDRLESDGQMFNIIGIKEPKAGQRRQLLEITAESTP